MDYAIYDKEKQTYLTGNDIYGFEKSAKKQIARLISKEVNGGNINKAIYILDNYKVTSPRYYIITRKGRKFIFDKIVSKLEKEKNQSNTLKNYAFVKVKQRYSPNWEQYVAVNKKR